MKQSRSLREALPDFIPLQAVQPIADWFEQNKVVLKISKERRTKLGDFRSSYRGKPPVISVNHNLNKYNFLITLLHEMAHAHVYLYYQRRQQPHGIAWKKAYREIALPYLHPGVFPADVLGAFTKYLGNPTASTSASSLMSQVLKGHDEIPAHEITVSMLSPQTLFSFGNGRTFRVIEKLRRRYRCYCLDNKKTYLFDPQAPIISIIESKKE